MARLGPTSTGTGTLPEPPELDLIRIVEALDRHGVEYLIVGGHAARAYCQFQESAASASEAECTGTNRVPVRTSRRSARSSAPLGRTSVGRLGRVDVFGTGGRIQTVVAGRSLP